MARESLGVKKYAVITVWRRGLGRGVLLPMETEDYFETVNWFTDKREAWKWYVNYPQQQTKTDGETNRLLVQVVDRWS